MACPTGHVAARVEMSSTAATELEWAPPQSTPEIYVNHVQIGMSLWDITAHFGSIVGVNPENGYLQVTKQVVLRLSPESTRALQLSLESALDQYEKAFGKLRFPSADAVTPAP
jgi:hypothetical protein